MTDTTERARALLAACPRQIVGGVECAVVPVDILTEALSQQGEAVARSADSLAQELADRFPAVAVLRALDKAAPGFSTRWLKPQDTTPPAAGDARDGWVLASEGLPEPGEKIDFAVIVKDGFVKRQPHVFRYVDATAGRSYKGSRLFAWRPAGREGER